MGKKCIPGVICIENMTLFILVVIISLTIYIYYNLVVKPNILIERRKNSSGNTSSPQIVVVSPPVNLGGIATRGDVLNNPYMPPLKSDGLYFRGDSSDIRGVPPPIQVPVNVETRGLNTQYSQVGILTKTTGGARDDLILPLMGRRHMSGRDKWQYYTISNTGNLNTKLPVSVNGKSCTSEYGCNEIMNGDMVYVEGYGNTFKATIYENNMFSYIPYL
jgi:hypothetical protein